MPRRSRRLMPLALAALLACCVANVQSAHAAEKAKEEGTKFLRFIEEGRDGGRLETAIATYKNDKGATVQLIGAVHIADPSYYDGLNKTFAGYDALLYEMVKPKDAEIGKASKANGVGLVHLLQRGMKDPFGDRMQGRMVSLYSMLFVGVTPLGNLFAGVVAHRWGPPAAVWLGGALTGAAGLAVLLYLTLNRR